MERFEIKKFPPYFFFLYRILEGKIICTFFILFKDFFLLFWFGFSIFQPFLPELFDKTRKSGFLMGFSFKVCPKDEILVGLWAWVDLEANLNTDLK